MPGAGGTSVVPAGAGGGIAADEAAVAVGPSGGKFEKRNLLGRRGGEELRILEG